MIKTTDDARALRGAEIRNVAIKLNKAASLKRELEKSAEDDPKIRAYLKASAVAADGLEQINNLLRENGLDGIVVFRIDADKIPGKPGKTPGVDPEFIFKHPETGVEIRVVESKRKITIGADLREWIKEYGISTVAKWVTLSKSG